MKTTARGVTGMAALLLLGTLVHEGTAQATITSTNTTNDSSNITYVFQFSAAGSFYHAYIDTDLSATTGFAVGNIGADYLLENGLLYHYAGPGWNWTQVAPVTYSNTGNKVSWTFSRASVGKTNCTADTANVVFQVQSSGGTFDTSGTFADTFIPCSSVLTNSVTTNDASSINYTVKYTSTWTLFQVFIDTDRNATTGYASGGIGAEYFVENGTLYQHTGSASSWTWNNLGSVSYTNATGTANWAIPRTTIGETQTNESADLFYRVQASGSSATLPKYTHIYFGSTTGGGGGSGGTGSGGTGGSGSGGSGGSTATGTIVPLYSDPSASAWTSIIAAKNSHPTVPVIAIVNPNSGPGTSVSSSYTTGIANLRAAGITVIGYVATGYAARAEASVQADINSWKSFYPAVTGIFFDEMSNEIGDVAFYQRQDTFARNAGLTYTVGNPGTDTIPDYVGVVNMILVYESAGLTTLPTWYSSYPASNFGVIPYKVANLDTTATNYITTNRARIGFIYMTHDDLPNPWDTLSTYFSSLLTALQ